MEDSGTLTDILKVIGGAVTGAAAIFGGNKFKTKAVESPEVAILRKMHSDQTAYYSVALERQDGHHKALVKLLEDGHEDRARMERKIEALSA